jgi:hypothetical protein
VKAFFCFSGCFCSNHSSWLDRKSCQRSTTIDIYETDGEYIYACKTTETAEKIMAFASADMARLILSTV